MNRMPRTLKIIYARYLIQRMAHRNLPLHQVIDLMQTGESLHSAPAPVLTRRLMLIITICTTWVIAAALTGASYGLTHALLLIPVFVAWVFMVIFVRVYVATNLGPMVIML